MAVHDRLRQAGGAARVDDPERMIEGEPARREDDVVAAISASKSCARPARSGERAVGRGIEVAPDDRRRRRSASRRAGWRPARFAVMHCAAVACSRRRRSAPSAAIWRKRSSTASGPMSAEHTDQTAPRLAQARKATAVCGVFGMKAATRSPAPTPIASKRGGERCDLAAQLGPGDLLAAAGALHRLVAKDDRRLAGARAPHRRGRTGAARSSPARPRNQLVPGIVSSASTRRVRRRRANFEVVPDRLPERRRARRTTSARGGRSPRAWSGRNRGRAARAASACRPGSGVRARPLRLVGQASALARCSPSTST